MEHHQLLFFFQKKENKRSTYVDTCKGAKSLLQQKCVVLTESTNVPDKQTEEVTKKARRGGGGGRVCQTHMASVDTFLKRQELPTTTTTTTDSPPPLPHPSLSVSLLHPSAVFISEATPTPCSPPFLKLQTFPSASNQVRAPKTNRQPKYIFIWPTSSTCFQFNFHVPTRKNHRLTNTANVNRLQLAGDFILTNKKTQSDEPTQRFNCQITARLATFIRASHPTKRIIEIPPSPPPPGHPPTQFKSGRLPPPPGRPLDDV